MRQTPEQHMAAMIANLPAKTGRTLEEWIEIVRGCEFEKSKERIEWLKQAHGIGHVYAQTIVWEAAKGPDHQEPTPEEYLAQQYAGPKAALRPIYDKLIEAATALGDDVNLRVCKTYVALERRRQFAVVQPSTQTRVDLGLSLPETAPAGRLQAAKSVGSGRTSHMIALGAPAEVDQEVLGWLKAAYEHGR